MLNSFKDPVDALVVGANGGLGQAFVDALLKSQNVRTVQAWSRLGSRIRHSKLASQAVDIGNESELRSAAEAINQLSLIIVATGVLHNPDGLYPEKSWKALDPANMAESFRINATIPALIAKHTLHHLPRSGRAVFCALSARVGSISDNQLGGWYSYRSSKAALNQIIKCLSIELRITRPDAICVGLHPGTVDTRLSEPFRKSLASNHRVFTPDEAAAHLLHVIDEATPDQSGAMLAWDGQVVSA